MLNGLCIRMRPEHAAIRMPAKTIAILGCGSLGRIIAERAENVSFVGVCDPDLERCDAAALSVLVLIDDEHRQIRVGT